MRRFAFALLALFVFTIPWEYSLEFGEPIGNVARVAGILTLLATIPAVLAAGRVRTPGPVDWLTLALFLWYCCTIFWTVNADATLDRLRGSFQAIMVVWLVSELAETPRDLRILMHAYVAGAWVLCALTMREFASAADLTGQARFVAEGQDPNDAARFLVMGLPLAAQLLDGGRNLAGRILALGYLPAGVLGVLLTASRGGALAAFLSLAGCAVLLLRRRPRRLRLAAICLPPVIGAMLLAVPRESFERLSTISEQLQGGDLNQRVNIWIAGWQAFRHAPFIGSGLGTFVSAAGLAPIDTAHNTALSVGVEGGVISLGLCAVIVACSAAAIWRTSGPATHSVRIGLGTALFALLVTTLDATVENNRTTWFLFALIAAAGRIAAENPAGMAKAFPAPPPPSAKLAPAEAAA